MDLGGLDLDLTYEDGLRLSELLGTRAELVYELDHIWMHSIVTIILLTILLLFPWAVATNLIYDSLDWSFFGRKVFEYDEDYDTFEPKRKWLYRGRVEEGHTTSRMYDPETNSRVVKSFACKQAVYTLSNIRVAAATLVLFAVLIVLVAVLVVMWGEYDLTRQLAGVDAQIEELVSRYI